MRISVGGAWMLLFVAASWAQAEPLNPKRVPAEAKWLVHVDAEALRASQVWDARYRRHEDKCRAMAASFAVLRAASGTFDASKDLKSITVYSTRFQAGTGAAIVRADFRPSIRNVLAESVRQMPGYGAGKHREHEVHTWTHDAGTGNPRTIAAAWVEPDLLVVGVSEAELTAALDVLDGVKPSLAGQASPLAYPMPRETLFLARAVGPWPDAFRQSPVAERSAWLSLALYETDCQHPGKTGKEAYLTGEFAARDSLAAQALRSTLESALTEMLTNTDDADVADVINTLEVFAREKTVSVDVHGAAPTGYYLDEIVDWLVTKAHQHLVGQGAN